MNIPLLVFIKGNQMKLLGKRVMIEPLTEEEKKGIIMLDESKEKPSKGKVIFIGTDVKYKITTNDVVFYGKYSGSEFKYMDKIYLILNEDDVIGIE